MGSINQLKFLGKRCRNPQSVLEVGSKQYGSTIPFRRVYPQADYVGVDLESGEGVDVLHNLEAGVGPLKPAELVICCSVLEHTPKPWVMAETLEALTSKHLYLAVPWVWRYHPYPDDYFRFSFSGVRSLFSNMEWDMAFSTNDGEFVPAEQGYDNSLALTQGKRKFLPYLELHCFGVKRGS